MNCILGSFCHVNFYFQNVNTMICFSWFNRRHGSNCSGPRLFFSHLRLQNGNPPVGVGRVSQLASCPIITSTANPPPLLYRLLYARIYDLSFNLYLMNSLRAGLSSLQLWCLVQNQDLSFSYIFVRFDHFGL